MKSESKIFISTIIVVLLSFLVPLPFWSILWLDIVIISTIFMYDYRALLIVAILLIPIILFLWLSQNYLSANRLTHFAFLWTLFGIIKFMTADLLNGFKKKIFQINGEILGELYHEDDPVVNLVKETIIIGIITGAYIVADIFINASWWVAV